MDGSAPWWRNTCLVSSIDVIFEGKSSPFVSFHPFCRSKKLISSSPHFDTQISLYNYRRVDKSKGLVWGNLELIRPFSGDPSEKGFIISHVTMVAHSGELVKNTMKTLEAAGKHNRQVFNDSLAKVVSTYEKINMEMDTMWERSLPADYLKFRTVSSYPRCASKKIIQEQISNRDSTYSHNLHLIVHLRHQEPGHYVP